MAKSTLRLCYQRTPVKKGDLVRIDAAKPNEREHWRCIAIVVHVDDHAEYPFAMRLLDHPYGEDIYPQRYTLIGNAVEAVALLESLRD